MQAATHFTPEQLIVAGRRAEQQGQTQYAQQFYRYLSEHYPTAVEAYEARDALYRLSQGAPEAMHPPQSLAPSPHPQPPVAVPPPAPLRPAATELRTGPRSAPTLEAGGPPEHGAIRHANGNKRAKARAAEPVPAFASEVDPPRGYRVGRLVAAMLNTIGWLLLISVVAAVPLIFAALSVKSLPKGLKDGIAGNLPLVGAVTFGTLMIGLFAVFAAQVARATFDTADATRALYNGVSRDEPS